MIRTCPQRQCKTVLPVLTKAGGRSRRWRPTPRLTVRLAEDIGQTGLSLIDELLVLKSRNQASMDPRPSCSGELEVVLAQACRLLWAGAGYATTRGQCVTSDEAVEAIRNRLGYSNWEIALGPGVQPNGCVGSTIDAVERRIVLIMALRLEVKEALAVAANELLDRCLGKGEAAQLITSVLTSLGETGWELRSWLNFSPPNRTALMG